jgi:hypothetical protein
MLWFFMFSCLLYISTVCHLCHLWSRLPLPSSTPESHYYQECFSLLASTEAGAVTATATIATAASSSEASISPADTTAATATLCNQLQPNLSMIKTTSSQKLTQDKLFYWGLCCSSREATQKGLWLTGKMSWTIWLYSRREL